MSQKHAYQFVIVICLSIANLLPAENNQDLYLKQPDLLVSRSISSENPTGSKGAGGKAKSNLGIGRKGYPCIVVKPGQTVTLADIDGPGVIRHVWMTTKADGRRFGIDPEILSGMVIRGYWENQKYPSIEVPMGAFFGLVPAKLTGFQSFAHSVTTAGGLNNWIQMPFAKHAKFTITNESKTQNVFFYTFDYTLGDNLTEPFYRLHAIYRRENPTTLKKDFEILPHRVGSGRYLGCILGIRPLSPDWWGEGEVKMYLDGDKEFPTICGTGTEDYFGQAWGHQSVTYLYSGGMDYDNRTMLSYYRWHVKDPIYWHKDIKITIQQLGTKPNLFERQDDVSCGTFWYEPVPSAKLPPMPDYETRAKNLPVQTKK